MLTTRVEPKTSLWKLESNVTRLLSNRSYYDEFHEMLKKDTMGLMELYEAAQLQLPEEEVLVEAANFSGKHLSESLQYLDPY
ncbi:hypothetical protein LIER_39270 [Lithospermum erythrorhizon]|uniref:Terpene synthase N-terminal domain-containing protein n=1 Tax=Lithospermum erythrorhizon TaxID=34254 RepID=A0AAV3QEQ2_LITER